MLKLKTEFLLCVSGLLGCSGIANRTVSETGVDVGAGGEGASGFIEGGGGAGGKGHAGFSASGGVAGSGSFPLGGAAPVGGGLPTGGAAMGPCLPASNPTPLHALSTWEYRRRVLELTGKEVTAALPSDPALPPPFAFSMAMNDFTVQQLFTEAETQSVSVDEQGLTHCASPADVTCITTFINTFVGGAFRRPLTDEEQQRYLSLYKNADAAGGPTLGAAMVVQATLFSPLFLFKIYLGSPSATSEPRSLTPYDVASRLASLFAGAGLDFRLWEEAGVGDLLADTGIASQTNRLLHEPRYLEVAQHFHAQWLGLDDLPAARPDLSPQLVDSMRTETELFIADVFTGERLLSSLLLSNSTSVDALLALRYHVPPPANGFAKVDLDPDHYFGVLTQSSTLTHFSTPSRRGHFVRERLFCDHMPPMPPGVPTDVPISPTQTERQAVMQALSDPSCAACHSQIDPVGFAFGHFDHDGLYRDTDSGFPIDTSGQPVNGAPFQDLRDLALQLSQSSEVSDCVARTWLSYALERSLGPGDDCTVRQLDAAFIGSNLHLDSLLTAIVRSTPFRTRDGFVTNPPPGPSPPIVGGSPLDPNQRRKMLLDFSLTETMSLAQMAAPEDKQTLDEYLGLLRDLEKQFSQF